MSPSREDRGDPTGCYRLHRQGHGHLRDKQAIRRLLVKRAQGVQRQHMAVKQVLHLAFHM